MSGHRKAALALHALAVEDRDLIFAALPVADAQRLRTLLAELDELGFVPEVTQLALTPAFDELAASTRADEQSAAQPIALVKAASPDAISAILAHEPASLIGVLLSIERWPWERAFLSGLSGEKRVNVEARRSTAGEAPARRAYVLDRVAGALRARANLPDQPARPPRPRRWYGWLNGVRSWQR